MEKLGPVPNEVRLQQLDSLAMAQELKKSKRVLSWVLFSSLMIIPGLILYYNCRLAQSKRREELVKNSYTKLQLQVEESKKNTGDINQS